ncbi:MAG TPA: nucleoside recognition domain-containing protein [Aggregatilinea sp.]|uniref:nucleoside recognition domain-containing protein n=1 Tax=Aggregatilinea sp. TaxID=2806333 RepID=UPI002C3721B5|nr:nucleoside recognition domain-containing protein [Aggregatilinea sp.]HML20762.1 nucleoside recognition domain-containing protein [Aggregatilinea sp.]
MSTNVDILSTAKGLRAGLSDEFHDHLTEALYTNATQIADRAVTQPGERPRFDLDRKIDQLVTSRTWGFPMMILMLTVTFWLTIQGANVPSQMLSTLLIGDLQPLLKDVGAALHFPWWLSGVLFDGAYLSAAWVISVMLPPMAIFFPLFTLLEDFGYLPRVAFNLDRMFSRAGAHGKQALSMTMGFGCNAAGVVATRVIDSPRERLIAIITNNFAVCNGRWPTLIMVSTVFIGSAVPAAMAGLISAAAVVGVAVLGVVMTFLVSWFLSKTWLKGEASVFSLELPPYRRPRIWQTIYTSVIDRTLIVLWRAVTMAIPAGVAIWALSNVTIGDASLAEHLVGALDGLGWLMGLNGVILVAYILAIPANEIVIPTVLMLTVLTTGLTGVGEGAGVMFELDSSSAIRTVLHAGGWTTLTAINLMLFSLIHNPCSTTILTIFNETKSAKWTAVAALLPLVMGFAITIITATIARTLGLV